MTSAEALIRLIQTYTALTDRGIEASSLLALEDELKSMPFLRADDFDAAVAKWTRRDLRPSIRELMNDLRSRNATEAARRVH